MSTNKQLPHIGSIEQISLPGEQLFDVPAKIDTGADSSAIWASDIRIDAAGTLSFVLFDAGSKYFNGRRITTKVFRNALVKNTSGEPESRYKVRLLIQIGDQRIRAWFNLADRSRMRYPVLLGRRLLRDRFAVDVSQRHLHSDTDADYNVLVLGAPERRVGAYFDEVAGLLRAPANLTARSFKDIFFQVETSNVTVTHEVLGIGSSDIADTDFVYFKTHRRNYEFAVAAAAYLSYRHVPFVDRELEDAVAYDKLNEMVKLALQGLAVPVTYCASSVLLRNHADRIITEIGLPLVCKEINADRGRHNYMLNSREQLLEVLDSAENSDRFMVQRYIPNEGYIRALVLGGTVALMIGRKPAPHHDSRKQHLNNPAGGDNAYLIAADDMPAQAKELALAAARCMRRQVAGVDLVQDAQTGAWYVLEVNNAPQIRSGAFVAEKTQAFAKFIDRQLNR